MQSKAIVFMIYGRYASTRCVLDFDILTAITFRYAPLTKTNNLGALELESIRAFAMGSFNNLRDLSESLTQ